jgi:predicted nuclease with TOPRIM domain
MRNEPTALEEYQKHQIEALQKENKRLNKELRKVKERVLKIRLSDPNFDKPLSEIETDYTILNQAHTL